MIYSNQPSAPFKADNGGFRSASLFYEKWALIPLEDRACDPVFSLYDDKDGLINCRSTFIELRDPTGYKWAMKYLKSWEHWQRLTKAPWFSEAVDIWVQELKTLLKQEAIEKIAEIALGSSPQALQAAKYLASAQWEKASSERGRPSKEEVKGELKKQMQVLNDIEQDAQRAGLKVIQGGKA